MARPIVLSNGEMHVGLNNYGLVHDLYFPYVGYENHAAGAKLRHKIGVYVDGAISWLDCGDWTFRFEYPHTALIGHTLAKNDTIGIALEFDDCVDSEISVFMRNIHVINLWDKKRDVKLFMHQAFAIGDSRSNTDTAQYLPDSDAILHYRGRRAFVISGKHNDEPFDQYSVGLFGIEGYVSTYKDAEDGELSGRNVEHGRVDSVIRFSLSIDPLSSDRAQYWVSAGMSIREALYVHKQIEEDGMMLRIHKTADWWKDWLKPTLKVAQKAPADHRDMFIKSAMIIKSQIDKRGAIMASTDSAMLNYSRDAYAYSWPRDGGYVIWPLIRLGYKDEAYRFFEFCKRGIHPSGYLMHKYRADGALGSSWHPYIHGDIVAPPIQEDETAIVVFMFEQFYQIQKDSSLIKDFYSSMIVPMATFMSEYIDKNTGLPKPTYDLWEQIFLTTTYTTSLVYAALKSASRLATIAGDEDNAVEWSMAADDIRSAAHQHLYNNERQVFYNGLISRQDGSIEYFDTVDSSSVFGAFLYNLWDIDSEEMQSSIRVLLDTFNVSDHTPALPRREDDDYRRTLPSPASNWWFITTLWLAQYYADNEQTESALNVLRWVRDHALSNGMLGEQINPENNQTVAPAPLTWSHAEYMSAVLDVIESHESWQK